MININLQNIEALLFKNPKIKPLLPDLTNIFDQWLLSYRIPTLYPMRKQAMIDLLNSLDGTHIEKLARLFGDMIFVEKLDYHIVKNLSFSICDSIEELNEYESYNNIAISRNADKLYMSLWR